VSRRERLRHARLYLVCDARSPAFLDAALRGGVDVIQLRDKTLVDDGLIAASRAFREAADAHGALFVLNDRPDLVDACAADGVHVGQDDAPPGLARRLLGDDAVVGLSTHAPGELDAAAREPLDYVSAGPVVPTPTKPGRPGTGPEYVRYAAGAARVPWFVTGGATPKTVGPLVAAGARRFVVVRWLTEAPDPEGAARALRRAVDEAISRIPARG
jgi:thiamine-phosphate pyrophosphorylase